MAFSKFTVLCGTSPFVCVFGCGIHVGNMPIQLAPVVAIWFSFIFVKLAKILVFGECRTIPVIPKFLVSCGENIMWTTPFKMRAKKKMYCFIKNSSMWTCIFYIVAASWQVSRMNAITARTTVRLWHELYVARGKVHEFSPLLSPALGNTFIGSVKYNEISAIAVCNKNSVIGIACHPDAPHAINRLIEIVIQNYNMSWDNLAASQPRAYLEVLWSMPPANKSISLTIFVTD